MFLRMNKALNDRRAGIKREEGFTLIELLVVVIIIGILAAIAIPIYIGVQSSSKDSGVKSDLANAKIAVVASATDNNGTFPTSLASLSSYGYTVPAATGGNYGTIPSITVNQTAGTFCIAAVSITSKAFHVSESSGVADGGAC